MEYNIILVDLPITINGMITIDENGHHTIFINAKISCCNIKKTIEHELFHCQEEHFFNNSKVKELEKV